MSHTRSHIQRTLLDSLINRLNPVEYVNQKILRHVGFNRKLWDYQEEMIINIADPLVRKLGIVCSRQAGKTEGVSLGALYLAYTQPYIKIGFFAPKEQQAAIDVNRIKEFIRRNKQAPVETVSQNATLIKFENGSEIHVISASDQAEIEGLTFDLMVLEESQKISDYTVSERILPMGGATGAKLIQIGTPKSRNHFWRVFKDPTYKKLKFDWLACHNLHRKDVGEGVIRIGERDFGRYVIGLMPRVLKQEFFATELALAEESNNQDLISVLTQDGEMSVDDFKTQYMLHWAEDAGAYLTEEEVKLMVTSDHEVLTYGTPGEQYYVGLDFASSEGNGSDYTAISVVRKTDSGAIEKVFFYELFGVSYPVQLEIIKTLFYYTETKRFNAISLFADYTGVGKPVVDMLVHDGLPVTGITFNASDSITKLGTNFKTSMFNIFKLELTQGRFKYPKRPDSSNMEQLSLYRKSIDEWADLETEQTSGSNKKIHAPEGGHEDHVSADILAVYAAVSSRRINSRPRGVLATFSRR